MDYYIKLKELREIKNMTQKEAGEKIGIDQRQWNRYENAKNEIPIHYVIDICKKFNVSADWLLSLK